MLIVYYDNIHIAFRADDDLIVIHIDQLYVNPTDSP